jgi:nucleoside-diphosphate-sugar epimerase
VDHYLLIEDPSGSAGRIKDAIAAGVHPPRRSIPAGIGRTAGTAVERVWAVRPGVHETPMTRFPAEQLSTAPWVDQRDIRQTLDWSPAVSIDEGLR